MYDSVYVLFKVDDPDELISINATASAAHSHLIELIGPVALTAIDTTGAYFDRISRQGLVYKITKCPLRGTASDNLL